MTLDGFLTALTLLVGLFALVPAVQRLRATLAAPVQGTLAMVAVLAILWLELREPALTCPSWLGGMCAWLELDGDKASIARKDAFLVVLAWALAAFAIHRFSRVRAGSVPALARLAARLIDEGRMGEALALLEPHVELFVSVSRRRGRWQRLHDQVQSFGQPDPWNFDDPPRRAMGLNWPGWASAMVRRFSALIPAQAEAEAAAIDTFRLVHHSPQLLAYMADQRPYLALPFLSAETYSRGEFSDAFLERLIASPGSALYQELEQNQNLEHPIGYALPERNRLLHFLFSDSRFAVRLGVWQPVGNYLERLLDGAETPGYIDRLNGSAKWYEREWWRDPAYVGFFFFDVMVTSALRQGVANHMWLFYFPHFAERIARVYDSSGPDIDRHAEFPTRAARLLYELVSYMTGWIKALPDLPDGSPHRTLPANRNQTGTNIPFSAATALGRTLAAILRSPRVDEEVTQTLHDVVMRMIQELPREGDLARLRQWVIEEVVHGGGGRIPQDYNAHLTVLFTNTDHVVRADIEDYAAALNAAA
ncbi:hypothetical protein [Novosphingobium mathurense]|uniref:Uncharacterized protein n=1 Tax=Novosphingobium mathurense TaxID=428990 RepID=A0A1U6H5Q1_9SPHN|nr:hypothetical protein [Novosphingobium mathurense]SLJ91099.1 hypothetical protein SAMN06295987_1011319 [Novosphingobium mathurense]